MPQRRPDQRRDLWLPGLVGLMGLLASLAGWGLLVSDRRDQLLRASRETGAETREAVELGLAEQLETLTGLSALWSEYGLRPPDEWAANVGQRIAQVDGLSSVAWVDLDGLREGISAGHPRTPEEVALDLEAARHHRGGTGLIGPDRDASGEPIYRVFIPSTTPSDHRGMLVARLHVGPFLDAALLARASGYALSARWQDEEIFRRGTPSSDPWQRWWWHEETVTLPLGGSWRVIHRPTPAFAASRLTPVPHYLLAAGVALSLVLALVAHQFRVIVRQARFLSASNRALELRGVELESKVAARTRDLEEVVSELEAFNYSVSHDLRSPLGAILNFTAILEEDFRDAPLGEEGLALLARIRRSATRATHLLEDLLRLSRAGRGALALESIPMDALVRESFALSRAADDEGEAVELRVGELPDAVGDRSLLGDVFVNLFGNALKYSRGREKRRVEVSGRREGREWIYEVADNGQGFDMRFVDKLFGLFERLDPDEEIEGTGVGLAMVARIVRRHGGRVWAEGTPGEGARFSFSLPVREHP